MITFNKLTRPLLDKVALVKCPPVIYTLGDGMKTSDLELPEVIGDWKFAWLGTGGTNTKGHVCLIPTNNRTRGLLRKGRLTYYQANGFTEVEAAILSGLTLRDYHDLNKLSFVRLLTRFTKTLEKGMDIINGHGDPTDTLRKMLAKEGHVVNLRSASLVDCFKVAHTLVSRVEEVISERMYS